ncbi:hypothetical protein [Bradyrhizobium japonicum]|uniref:hypothetical protein n=1 Tax=Bradyrhizobium japonicum TaxID=375 RepID=UPI0032215EE1
MSEPVVERGRMFRRGSYGQDIVEIAIGAPAPFAAKDALAVVPQDLETGISVRGDRRGHIHLPDSGTDRPPCGEGTPPSNRPLITLILEKVPHNSTHQNEPAGFTLLAPLAPNIRRGRHNGYRQI